MRKQMHHVIQRALKLAERPDGALRLAAVPRSREDVRSNARGESLIGLLNWQIVAAQARLTQLTDPGERVAQAQLIAELRKHVYLEMRPQGACA